MDKLYVNQMNQQVRINETKKDIVVNGMSNQLVIKKNKHKIQINGMNNTLIITENDGVVIINGLNNTIKISKHSRRGRIMNNSPNSVVKGTNNRRNENSSELSSSNGTDTPESWTEESESEDSEENEYHQHQQGIQIISSQGQWPGITMSIRSNGQRTGTTYYSSTTGGGIRYMNVQAHVQGSDTETNSDDTETHSDRVSSDDSVSSEEEPKYQEIIVFKEPKGLIQNEDCVICAGPFGKESPNAAYLDCFHWFHYKCIMTWFRKKKECPVCRHKCAGAHRQTTNP